MAYFSRGFVILIAKSDKYTKNIESWLFENIKISGKTGHQKRKKKWSTEWEIGKKQGKCVFKKSIMKTTIN